MRCDDIKLSVTDRCTRIIPISPNPAVTPLSRALLEAGGIDAMLARDAPHLRLLTEAERAESLRATLAARPEGDVWLFAYGSLIWNPTIRVVEQRTARIQGWHRAFCLSTIAGRGTLELPGLVLGLDAGGHCEGLAFRLAEEDLEGELTLVWRREMVASAYVPRWMDVLDRDGRRFGGAITFTIDPAGTYYAGGLAAEAVIERLATAAGHLGSSAEYLFQTRDGLRAHGIPDPELEALAAKVEAVRAAR
jgi:cation transport protein ChaC